MNPSTTAVILIGYQKDYFDAKGALHAVVEASVDKVLSNTLDLLDRLESTDVIFISTPIHFTQKYKELAEPVIGILQTIRDVKAFRKGTRGAQTIDEFKRYGDRITVVEGKRGLNAFHETHLQEVLEQHNITDVVLAGVVTSICIDSTGRSAFELGYRVTVLSDCTAGRSLYEQEFYCNELLPLYARVMTYTELIDSLQQE